MLERRKILEDMRHTASIHPDEGTASFCASTGENAGNRKTKAVIIGFIAEVRLIKRMMLWSSRCARRFLYKFQRSPLIQPLVDHSYLLQDAYCGLPAAVSRGPARCLPWDVLTAYYGEYSPGRIMVR
jgi:hypothetical protein